jgi:hypothetical protein
LARAKWDADAVRDDLRGYVIDAFADEQVQQRLLVVTINLGQKDDAQLIFETLNDRGTPLLAADLIKNLIFQRGDELGADVDAWGEAYWADFDEDWWRKEVQQGRLFRSRIDLFLQYWLTMLEQDEIPAEQVFARFRKYAEAKLDDVATAESLLVALRRDADTFRGFADLLVIVLSAIEQKRRTEKNENVTLPSKLQIEHVMPQKWRINWSDGLLDDPVASAQRDRVIHTIGNLTLVSGSLNASLSNRPWRDSDAAVVAPTGPEAGKLARTEQGDCSGAR